jgi:hypothetical protein
MRRRRRGRRLSQPSRAEARPPRAAARRLTSAGRGAASCPAHARRHIAAASHWACSPVGGNGAQANGRQRQNKKRHRTDAGRGPPPVTYKYKPPGEFQLAAHVYVYVSFIQIIARFRRHDNAGHFYQCRWAAGRPSRRRRRRFAKPALNCDQDTKSAQGEKDHNTPPIMMNAPRRAGLISFGGGGGGVGHERWICCVAFGFARRLASMNFMYYVCACAGFAFASFGAGRPPSSHRLSARAHTAADGPNGPAQARPRCAPAASRPACLPLSIIFSSASPGRAENERASEWRQFRARQTICNAAERPGAAGPLGGGHSAA